MKIYTGTGDHGKASLLSGERVIKSHERIEACGDVDELNSILGILAGVLPAEMSELGEEIQQFQSDLLHVGAWLATTPDSPFSTALMEISEEQISRLEDAIDRMEENLPTLRSFIIPCNSRVKGCCIFAVFTKGINS